MTGRHERCPICGTGRVLVLRVAGDEPARRMTGEEITTCTNRDCSSNHPTGPVPAVFDNKTRAEIEVESIKRELRERLDRGEG